MISPAGHRRKAAAVLEDEQIAAARVARGPPVTGRRVLQSGRRTGLDVLDLHAAQQPLCVAVRLFHHAVPQDLNLGVLKGPLLQGVNANPAGGRLAKQTRRSSPVPQGLSLGPCFTARFCGSASTGQGAAHGVPRAFHLGLPAAQAHLASYATGQPASKHRPFSSACLHDLGCAQLVAAVDDVHLAAVLREEVSLLHGCNWWAEGSWLMWRGLAPLWLPYLVRK